MEENKVLLDKDGKPITKEYIEQVMKDLFIDMEPLVQKYEWEEDGQLCHTWKINCGNGRSVHTNDAGLQQLNDAIKKDIENGMAKR